MHSIQTTVCTAYRWFILFLNITIYTGCSHTVSSRFAALRGKVDSLPNTTTRVGHDAKSRLQNGCHYCYVSTMPEQSTVSESIVSLESIMLQIIHTVIKSKQYYTTLRGAGFTICVTQRLCNLDAK